MKAEAAEIVKVDGHDIKVTRPGKVLFPGDGITKSQLIGYYQQVGPRMLPYLAGRPLTLQRFPDGIGRPGFIQKAAAPYFPDWNDELRGEGTASEQLARGEIKFALDGIKLRGEFVLVHSGARATSSARAKRWLLIKHRDEHADQSWDLESSVMDRSVVSGRTLEEIAAGRPVKRKTAGGSLASD